MWCDECQRKSRNVSVVTSEAAKHARCALQSKFNWSNRRETRISVQAWKSLYVLASGKKWPIVAHVSGISSPTNSDEKMNYNIELRAGHLVIVAAKEKDLGCAHRLGCDDEIPAIYQAQLRKQGAELANYFWCGGYPVRVTHRVICEQLIAEARATFAASPEGLREKRDSLSRGIGYARTSAEELRTRNFHKYDTGRGMGRNDYDSKAEALSAELRAFDAAHPEVLVAIEVEKAAAHERFLAYD